MPVTVERFGADAIRAHLAEFVDLLRDVVDHGASVNFLAPLDPGGGGSLLAESRGLG